MGCPGPRFATICTSLPDCTLPLDFVSPVRSTHLAFGNILSMSVFKSLVPLRAVRRARHALLSKAYKLHSIAVFGEHNMTFSRMTRRSLRNVVARKCLRPAFNHVATSFADCTPRIAAMLCLLQLPLKITKYKITSSQKDYIRTMQIHSLL